MLTVRTSSSSTATSSRSDSTPQGIVVDDAWQTATSAGVDALQASLGETETGTLALGQIVFLPGDRLVSGVSAPLGSQAALRVGPPAPEFVSLTSTGARAPDRGANHEANTAPTVAALLALLRSRGRAAPGSRCAAARRANSGESQ